MIKVHYLSFIKIVIISVLLSFLYYNKNKTAHYHHDGDKPMRHGTNTKSPNIIKIPETNKGSLEIRILRLVAQQSRGKYVKEELQKFLLFERRRSIEEEFKNYTFHPSLKVKDASDLMIKSGGTPIRNLIVTTWRSGSTFLGDIIQSHPGMYYIFEPLHSLSDIRIKEPKSPNASEAISILEKLYSCDYLNLEQYLQHRKGIYWLILHNKHQRQICEFLNDNTSYCVDKEFYAKLCSMVPFQLLKTVRLQMKVLENELIKGRFQDLRVIYLVRDPRGTMLSRSKERWCPSVKDCSVVENLCTGLEDDYITIKRLRQTFPHQIMVIRYEDMSVDVENQFEKIFDFFRLNFTSTSRNYIYLHSVKTSGHTHSTYRNSKEHATLWTKKISWARTIAIQNACVKAMSLWGYLPARDIEELRSFNPVKNLTFD